tara:strand:+ start:794 stop:934 length:141 start_codon:yes stop_codon:yes gene_type:complete
MPFMLEYFALSRQDYFTTPYELNGLVVSNASIAHARLSRRLHEGTS